MSEELTSIFEFETDIANAEQPAPLPAGIYNATITAVTPKVSKSGNKYASVSFKVSADEYPADYVDGNKDGTTLTYNRVMLEDNARNRWALKNFCQKIGAAMTKRIDLNEWLGATARIEVVNEPYENTMMASITRLVD